MQSAACLPELVQLERLIARAPAALKVREVCAVNGASGPNQRHDPHRYPIHALTLGSDDPRAPAIGFFGGVHGLERIGTQVLLHFMEHLVDRLAWDHALHRRLESVRLVFMPLVNPGGMANLTRCNPRGVDLMRNAPVDATAKVPFLAGGQRLTPRLPWYRGAIDDGMEAESRAVCQLVEQELLGRPFALALDCHSGFGFRDRIWFPYAHTAEPIRHLPEMHALKGRFDRHHPRHDYTFEPQSRQYLTHGDLWDHLYQRALHLDRGLFLPLTLEMGSWAWTRACPRRLFSRLGIFNPMPRQLHQVLQSHLPWLDFLSQIGTTCADWLPLGSDRARHEESALTHWYRPAPLSAPVPVAR